MRNTKVEPATSEEVAEQRRKLIDDLTRTVVKLPNGGTYTVLKPYSADQQLHSS